MDFIHRSITQCEVAIVKSDDNDEQEKRRGEETREHFQHGNGNFQ